MSNNSKKTLLYTLFPAIIIWVVATLVFATTENKKSDVLELAASVVNHESKKESVRLLAQDLEKLQAEFEELESFAVGISQKEVVSFIEKIEKLAEVSGVQSSVEKIDVIETEEGFFEMLELTIKAFGGWGGVFHFLSLVENLPYQIDVKNIVLESKTSEQEDSAPEWQLQISFQTLKFK